MRSKLTQVSSSKGDGIELDRARPSSTRSAEDPRAVVAAPAAGRSRYLWLRGDQAMSSCRHLYLDDRATSLEPETANALGSLISALGRDGGPSPSEKNMARKIGNAVLVHLADVVRPLFGVAATN